MASARQSRPPRDHGHDRRPQPGHERDRAGDRFGDAALLRLGPGVGTRNVDERDDREAEALGELHDPDRLAIALQVRHPEVAPDVLVGVGPLLLTDDRDHAAVEPGQAGHDRGVVAEEPVAVQLDEVLDRLLDELERPAASAGCGPAGRGPTPPRYGRRCCRPAMVPVRSRWSPLRRRDRQGR